MTLQKPLGLPLGLTLSEPLGLPLQKPLGLGIPYSLLLTPNSHLPSPSWFRTSVPHQGDATGQAEISPTPSKKALQRWGIKTARTPENLTAVRDLTEAGWSAREIAARLDIAPATVSSIRTEIGCPGPLMGDATDDVDEVAVMRAVNGDRAVTINPAERREAVAQLTARGLSARAIAEQLGISERTVCRHRANRRDHAA